jgi:hypothetical protein
VLTGRGYRQPLQRQLDLVEIELHARVLRIEQGNLLNAILLVVVKYFHIPVVKQVQIDFVVIIANGRNENTFLVKRLYLLRQ